MVRASKKRDAGDKIVRALDDIVEFADSCQIDLMRACTVNDRRNYDDVGVGGEGEGEGEDGETIIGRVSWPVEKLLKAAEVKLEQRSSRSPNVEGAAKMSSEFAERVRSLHEKALEREKEWEEEK